ncbi:MAG: AbrB/MazE/SpoVT family DNA-binding domain-containing protein [Pseudomonadota bacterium]
MRTTITEHGQTEIPAEILRRFGLTRSDRLEWVVEADGIRVIPVPANPVEAFRGRGKGGATQRLLEDRRAESAGE